MNNVEQFEAWIEQRVIERRATRGEVYALRRYRRSATPRTLGLLMDAYVYAVLVRPFVPVISKLSESMARAATAMNEVVLRFNIAEIESADLGEFDNRARDWFAGGDDAAA